MGFSKRKYGNKKIEVDGVKFDSKLEMKCYNLLKEMGFSFEFQKQITLVDKFRYNKEAIRAITIVVDFVLDHDGHTIYIDTKGFATEVSKIKYKMLRYILKDEENTDVVWLHTQKEVSDYLIKLKEEK
jgi:hypothetical protein